MIRWNLYNQQGRLIKSWPANEREPSMNVHQFAVEVTKQEGKVKQMSIAQVKELLKVVNGMLEGDLYRLIKSEKVGV